MLRPKACLPNEARPAVRSAGGMPPALLGGAHIRISPFRTATEVIFVGLTTRVPPGDNEGRIAICEYHSSVPGVLEGALLDRVALFGDNISVAHLIFSYEIPGWKASVPRSLQLLGLP